MKQIKYIFDNYWLVLLVGAWFALTCIYNEWGQSRDVFWNTYIKTIREGLLIGLFFGIKKSLNNTVSILFCYGGIAVTLSYVLFRFYCGIKSNFVELIGEQTRYSAYFDFMKDNDYRLLMSIIILIVLLFINYINRK
jgi:hypothetical protein